MISGRVYKPPSDLVLTPSATRPRKAIGSPLGVLEVQPRRPRSQRELRHQLIEYPCARLLLHDPEDALTGCTRDRQKCQLRDRPSSSSTRERIELAASNAMPNSFDALLQGSLEASSASQDLPPEERLGHLPLLEELSVMSNGSVPQNPEGYHKYRTYRSFYLLKAVERSSC